MDMTRELSDGFQIPAIGFGTYPMRGEEARTATLEALDVGYRMVDSAFNYDNEAAVGRAINDSPLSREDIFIASKLPGRYHERPLADDALRESLWRTGLDYLDLYLIHWPNPSRGFFVEAWQALLEAKREGLVKSVGVSNFTADQLLLLQEATGELPVVNQIECHPYFPQEEMLKVNKELGIQTIAWSPLGKRSKPAEEPVISDIANEVGVQPTQVVLRWHLERGIIPIPKSANRKRIESNFDIFNFSLTEDQVAQITALAKPDGRLFDGDPRTHEEL